MMNAEFINNKPPEDISRYIQRVHWTTKTVTGYTERVNITYLETDFRTTGYFDEDHYLIDLLTNTIIREKNGFRVAAREAIWPIYYIY
jgi:hypothetical protein